MATQHAFPVHVNYLSSLFISHAFGAAATIAEANIQGMPLPSVYYLILICAADFIPWYTYYKPFSRSIRHSQANNQVFSSNLRAQQSY